jgi:RNA polymerase sigma factor (sigma-70 family)
LNTEDARNELALHAMHEAIPYARRVCRGGLPDDELFSLCWSALCKAAKQFKPNRVRFFAYAKVSVRRGICDAWRQKDVVKHASIHEVGELHHIKPDYHMEGADGDYPENLRIGQPSEYGSALSGVFGPVVDPETEQIEIRDQWAIVEPLMRAKLSKNEFMTLDLHYRGGMNFQEIGDILGVVREATRLTHIRALKKIRAEVTRKKALL